MFFVHHWVNWTLRNNFYFLHFLHGVDLFCWLFIHFPNLSEASLSNNKITGKWVETNLMKILFFILLSAVFACCSPIGPWKFIKIAFDLATWSNMLQIIEVNMPKLLKMYKKFPTRSFLSFYLDDELIPKLLFLVWRAVLF